MKKMAIRICAVLLCISVSWGTAQAAEYLIPVGEVIGLELSDHTVTVAAFDEVLGIKTREAGLQVGDRLLEINGKAVTCAEDVRSGLQRSNGAIRLCYERNGKRRELLLQPEITKDGPKLGVFLKQGVTGIGTVTWYNPENGSFGALGHGVSGANGEILQMESGSVYAASVVSVQPGKVGKPGQLRGTVASAQVLGELKRNTGRGVFGVVRQGWQGKPVPVAEPKEVKPGAAAILSTVSGEGVREYSVEIVKIYPKTKSGDKNMVIRITDPRLLETTGGIVQGMSGSPIIQDGKLVGAVTHVLVNDPTTGYGIFIENMLDAAA